MLLLTGHEDDRPLGHGHLQARQYYVSVFTVSLLREESETRLADRLVDRLRSAVRRDIESNQVFLMVGLAYVSTNPDMQEAANLFRTFTFLSLTHSVACVVEDKVPRLICWVVGQGVNLFMGVRVLQCIWEVI